MTKLLEVASEMEKRNFPKRVDGLSKITGKALYVDDIPLNGVLHASTIRSSCAGGVVEELTFDPTFDWTPFVVVTAKDIPGLNAIKMLENDQPVLVDRVFRHAGEPLALLAHSDPCMLETALRHVHVRETPLAHPVFDIDEALGAESTIIPDNVYTDYLLNKGDVEQAQKNAECLIVERLLTPSQEQLYIEPQGMIAVLQEDGVLRIEGSMQCPYYVLDALEQCTGLDKNRLQVVQSTTGGAFGGKEDYPSMIACHAALLALKSGGLPVKLIYERSEDLRVTPKRHPSRSLVRLGANSEGELQFIDMDFAIDGGAYRTLSPVVLSRGVIHAPGPYRCANIRVRGRAVATNHPPFGAFRGFGAPQSIFALEVAMDRLAAKLNMDPAELRRKNLLHRGDVSPTGDLVGEDCFAQEILDEALRVSHYYERQDAFRVWNAAPHDTFRGIGLATFAHGAGFTGNGELYLASRVFLHAHADGQVEILCSNTEMGQGAATTLVQIAADALQLPLEQVHLAQTDTARVPNSGPTVASRTCMVVGDLIEKAAQRLLQKLRDEGGLAQTFTPAEFNAVCLRMQESGKDLLVSASYQPPVDMLWDEKSFTGRAYASYAWAAYIAEVEVDKLTLETRVLNFTAAQEIGLAVHPQIVQGQIEGGVVQGIGYALYEKVLWNPFGVMANDRLTNYIIPTTADIGPLQIVLMEKGLGAGPKGAKGVGELPMDGPAPAIVNAIQQALKIDVAQIPAMPELLLDLSRVQRGSQCQ
ncbi:xanthine dehydrogenase [Acidithiobacillus thiooxidans]|uniref:Xanthine dehydrogenase n=1 Tax=Acidithiobacillus thiooxidans TaxID=930 RepID=A0A1C2JFN1_ACITH|nr:xanthine dehydrogenase family protein molybdopterin-binding subunit [Acidithiobacillus thiooxidans]OCX71975.1 xanthine dehydrogenase [Acidithiobacillus thiooxidans]OCX72551.1 xanthine dehydrogenase [Acidithiobacillus thiooxidans]OCX75345.1 xanthine dehydrogenase [Acidithiobacillus thiooxidans]OCX79339.1 xanthine dehydrogenase [Acidithiobacillus thiooxidans]OCX84080.1 xanthine dehydrogenase [Acidithiobacillus thiooxidans]